MMESSPVCTYPYTGGAGKCPPRPPSGIGTAKLWTSSLWSEKTTHHADPQGSAWKSLLVNSQPYSIKPSTNFPPYKLRLSYAKFSKIPLPFKHTERSRVGARQQSCRHVFRLQSNLFTPWRCLPQNSKWQGGAQPSHHSSTQEGGREQRSCFRTCRFIICFINFLTHTYADTHKCSAHGSRSCARK